MEAVLRRDGEYGPSGSSGSFNLDFLLANRLHIKNLPFGLFGLSHTMSIC